MSQYIDHRQLGEGGFTFIELLWVMAIVAILSAIGYVQFLSYSKNAEFTKAELDLKNARTALEAGFDYVAANDVFGLSGSHGEPLAGDLAAAMPGMNVTDRVMLRVSTFNCGDGVNYMQFLTAYACEANLYTWWIRTCAGMEFRVPKAAMGAGFC